LIVLSKPLYEPSRRRQIPVIVSWRCQRSVRSQDKHRQREPELAGGATSARSRGSPLPPIPVTVTRRAPNVTSSVTAAISASLPRIAVSGNGRCSEVQLHALARSTSSPTRSAHSPNGLPGPCWPFEGRRPATAAEKHRALLAPRRGVVSLAPRGVLVHVLSTPLAGIPGFRQMGSQVGRWPR
jgi:hypothetical protein